MTDIGRQTDAGAPNPGLCTDCAHTRIITNRSGSRFYLCERSRDDPRFPRYPRLPTLRCDGYEPREGLLFTEDSLY